MYCFNCGFYSHDAVIDGQNLSKFSVNFLIESTTDDLLLVLVLVLVLLEEATVF